ncbi:MAG: hypothetical protein KGJ79_16205 [Alphaproteobacteria bacterium]|nr:hypothetical protein [Alphaproteobacteria bacterium]MDE2494716.1 hypothetical protein [Alphaproteobacteria bacterium]
MQRLRLRYLDPIDTLQMNSSYRGEGFSIVAIQVTLIEFLAATVAGMSYRHRKKGDPALTTYEYDRSAALFIDFLSSVPPFSTEFTKTTADEFYVNIRCGLLHEARTKQGWSVWAESHAGQMVDPNRKIVFRNNLQSGLLAFLDIYRKRIVREKNLQVALVRKIDSLCME